MLVVIMGMLIFSGLAYVGEKDRIQHFANRKTSTLELNLVQQKRKEKLKGEWPRAEKSRAQANQCLEGVS